MKIFAVFAGFLALYVATMSPALAPYRDTGEMAVAAATLGVAHPTSYPSYVMLGHMAQQAPIGNKAYRLGLLSAAAAALACAGLFAWACRRWGWAAGLGAALLLGLNSTFWSVAQVQEMYSLWMVAAVGLMALTVSLRDRFQRPHWLGFVFIAALALTNRLDLLLWAPGLLWLALGEGPEQRQPLWAALAFIVFPAVMVASGSNWPILALIAATAWWRCPAPRRAAFLATTVCWAAAGLSLYFFLPIRSATGPWLDWNHPATLPNFIESLLRTRYGGTLDLLSKNYRVGELFVDNLRLYGSHLWNNFWIPGLVAVAAGVYRSAAQDPRRSLGMAAAYWWSGPVFLFIANMPPNPHAAAIVEPHYLLSDLVLVFWAAEGLGALGILGRAAPALAGALLLIAPLSHGHFERFNRRNHFYSYDFARSVFVSAPPQAIVVAKKDVQLYSLWSYQRLNGWRPDVRVVAQGLAGSAWYQNDWKRRDRGVALFPLNDAEGWSRLSSFNASPISATPDVELPGTLGAQVSPRGMVYALNPSAVSEAWLWELIGYRGRDTYATAQDFFTSDLIDSRAQALFRQGSQFMAAGRHQDAKPFLLGAWHANHQFPEPPLYLGYSSYAQGDLKQAHDHYGAAARVLERLSQLAQQYRALPGVSLQIKRSEAETLTHLGVVTEKLGDRAAAQRLYERAAARYPLAQAHYNLAVSWWNKDWERARRELEETLKIDPGHGDAARYLKKLNAR